MDTQRTLDNYKQEWFDKVQQNSEDLFNVAEEAIKKDSNLKVFIFKRLPRFDKGSADLMRIKSQLSEFGNSIYDQLWLRKGSPKNIQVLEFDLGCSGQNRSNLRRIIYGDPNSSYFDGLHLRGRGAQRHFNYRASKALKSALSKYVEDNQKIKAMFAKSTNYHGNRPQPQYQRRKISEGLSVVRGNNSQPKSYSDAVKSNNQSQTGPYTYAVPTSNYYNHLNLMNM